MASKRHGDNLAEAARKKRLGQYFSGIRLSRGLASIASARDARTVIDPMGGVGDMIAAALYAGGAPKEAVTIEIDPAAHNIARESFSNVSSNTVTSVLGNCFDKRIIKGLPQKDYDLVITNPPYVRYQSLSKAHTSDISVPSAVEIRNTLIDVVRYFPHLDSKDKELISTLISSYSGLSDLAVPSWFLCAMLTRIGGTLAMVVPESWLTRDYAQIVQYLLFRWFRIRYVVEDSQAVWFSDALVKTTLLVAERIESKDSILDWNEEGYLHVKIDGRAMNMGSIVGNQFPDSANPDESLAELLTQISKRKTGLKNGYIDANRNKKQRPKYTLLRQRRAMVCGSGEGQPETKNCLPSRRNYSRCNGAVAW
jgi:predicted RNA methylase